MKDNRKENTLIFINKFIGSYEIRRIFTESDSKEQEMYLVTFKNGGMTKNTYT